MPPYGWYPDPEGRYLTGFWDGTRWRITLLNDRLIIDTDVIVVDEITAVSYWNKTIRDRRLTTPSKYVDRGFSVADSRGTKTLRLTDPGKKRVPESDAAWNGLVDISRRFIEPRLCQRIVGWLRAGRTFTIENRWFSLVLSGAGFTISASHTETHPWTDFDHAAIGLTLDAFRPVGGEDGQVKVYGRSGMGRGPHRLFSLWNDVPNVVLLPTLMPMCAEAFAARLT